MKLHQLQALSAVADAGSIRAAARLLGLSQAAVTKALRELESEVQLSLLHRTARGVAFTEAGQRLLAHARLVVHQVERAGAELADLRGQDEGQAGRLSVALTPWIMLTFLSETLQRFRERMPRVQLEIFEGLTAVALPRLREGLLDFAVVPFTAAMSDQEFDSEPLLAYGSCVIASREHPCATETSLHRLLEQDWVVNYTSASYPALMQNLFWQHGARIEPCRLHCAHSTTLLLEMVRHAGMLSYCPRPLLLSGAMRGWSAALPLAEQFETTGLGIITRRNALQGSAAQCFVDCLKAVIRRRARSAAREDRELFDLLDVRY
ncbi:LysR family transcriptional regulator [Cupriavidus sp. IDO]|uniref:LysR family transcriptional regulator n=1 Tax=Cupriavidus sp. IDO TaxID=1539142 RepID=UPI0005795332|nr:LysR family transcriptional regulator [Cupriavidus sp. IDO]KWR75063.1 LysR family transcriptional regulator [Cupriavidus sp. IDO]